VPSVVDGSGRLQCIVAARPWRVPVPEIDAVVLAHDPHRVRVQPRFGMAARARHRGEDARPVAIRAYPANAKHSVVAVAALTVLGPQRLA
jgi:hypothetical protein